MTQEVTLKYLIKGREQHVGKTQSSQCLGSREGRGAPLTCPESGRRTPGSEPPGRGRGPCSPPQVCTEMTPAGTQLSRGAAPGRDTRDAGPREAAPCPGSGDVSGPPSFPSLWVLVLPAASGQRPAGPRDAPRGTGLDSPFLSQVCRGSCGSSCCRLAGGPTQSRSACRCCASLAHRGCWPGRCHRGRSRCAAPASPRQQASWHRAGRQPPPWPQAHHLPGRPR